MESTKIKKCIFEPRKNYKPFEYPEVLTFTDAINKSFWVHSEVDFTADIQDFKSNLSPIEKEVVKRSLLSIAQVEVAVKTFWGNLYEMLPKPEFNGLGATFAECEFRHSEAYSRLLTVLGMDSEFERLDQFEALSSRFDYLSEEMKIKPDNDSRMDSVRRLFLFTIFIENTSLFSQFANILSFTRFKGYMKNVSNIIAWTSIDEQLHANAGIYIINKIKEEQPEILEMWDYRSTIRELMESEFKLLDWIYEQGELEFFSKTDMINFMKFRVDDSLTKLGLAKLYNVTTEGYDPMKWFEEDVFSQAQDDFFAKRPVDYTKHDKSITGGDIF